MPKSEGSTNYYSIATTAMSSILSITLVSYSMYKVFRNKYKSSCKENNWKYKKEEQGFSKWHMKIAKGRNLLLTIQSSLS